MEKIKVIFMGTSEFAVPTLKTLMSMPEVALQTVVTQPDRPAGRRQELKMSPVKEMLSSEFPNVSILQPERIKEATEELRELEPDIILVAAYGQIVPQEILDIPKYGALNLHGSLLPEFRGAVPVHMAILNGLEQTGVTLQKMVYEMDKGDILVQSTVELCGDETTESLISVLAEVAAEIIGADLKNWVEGTIVPDKQRETEATYCYKGDISKESAEVSSATTVEQAERMVRAFYPWPVAWVQTEKGRLKIFKAKHQKSNDKLQTSSKLQVPTTNANQPWDENFKSESSNGKLQVASSRDQEIRLVKTNGHLGLELLDGILLLEEVQLEGRKRGSGKEYYYLT